MNKGKVAEQWFAFFFFSYQVSHEDGKDETPTWEKEAKRGPTASRIPHQFSCFEWQVPARAK